jgi:hypothetical protein
MTPLQEAEALETLKQVAAHTYFGPAFARLATLQQLAQRLLDNIEEKAA